MKTREAMTVPKLAGELNVFKMLKTSGWVSIRAVNGDMDHRTI